MPRLIQTPNRFPQEDIQIEEFFGLISSGESDLSLCRIHCRRGWSEPAQRPEFDEYLLVLTGALHLVGEGGSVTVVRAGEAALAPKGELVQYATPDDDCDYVSLCVPAFRLDLAHRE